ncbi:MAG TPA: DUF362 domain-containing protein [Bryobacteraceae bacterium]|nr:DUF362 domain-containing protein [Bryobacteraceae bacterium]
MDRRRFVQGVLLAPASAAAQRQKLGIPGSYPGRIIAVEDASCLVSGKYQPQPIRQMIERGMKELTRAPSWPEAWRAFFEKGDVVGIKVSPVGGLLLSSDPSVLRSLIDGLNQAGVSNRNILVFSRYRQEILEAGIDKWLPPGVRFDAPSLKYDDVQLDMGGYDPNHFMEMALLKPGDSTTDEHLRRSYVSKIVTSRVNKIINLPVLKHHQSAGVTICLKNMSHGFVNNVNRSHMTPTLNACGVFIPSVVRLPVIREKVVLHVVDAVKASYHGGPGAKPRFIWEPKTLLFGTDPVALDKTGLKMIDAQRQRVGMASIALSKPDKDSHFLNAQVEHIEIAGMLGLGEFSDEKIHVNRIKI